MLDGFAQAVIALTQTLPRRDIFGEAGLYLSRWTMATTAEGGHVYVHRFARSDIDHELHNHPWAGTSLILAGGYSEERRDLDGQSVNRRRFAPGDVNTLAADTFHRVDLLADECWTLFITSAAVQSWGFWDRGSGGFTDWKEALTRRGLLESRHPGLTEES